MLRSRRSRREEPLALDGEFIPDAADPERDAVMSESIGLAMVAVLEHLAPAERVAFVLHDVFGVSFEEIAAIVGRSPVAARQLASRGRRRAQGVPADTPVTDVARHRVVVEAFFSASRRGDFQALLAVLDPDVVLRPDAEALRMGVRTGWLPSPLRGADAVATRFAGQAQAAQVALIDGLAGGVWVAGGRPVIVFAFKVRDGRIVEIELVADPERLERTKVETLT
jgi:RNA polymerase sigma-70 factor (ECF subfamily)